MKVAYDDGNVRLNAGDLWNFHHSTETRLVKAGLAEAFFGPEALNMARATVGLPPLPCS